MIHPVQIRAGKKVVCGRGIWITQDKHAKTEYTVHLWSKPEDHPDPERQQSGLQTSGSRYKLVRFHVGKDMGRSLVLLDGIMWDGFEAVDKNRGVGMPWKAVATPFFIRAVLDNLAVLNTGEFDRDLCRKQGTIAVGTINYPSCLKRLVKALKMGWELHTGAEVSETVPSRIAAPEVLHNAYHVLMPSIVERELGLKRPLESAAAPTAGGAVKGPIAATSDTERPIKRARPSGGGEGTLEDPFNFSEAEVAPLRMVRDKLNRKWVRGLRSKETNAQRIQPRLTSTSRCSMYPDKRVARQRALAQPRKGR